MGERTGEELRSLLEAAAAGDPGAWRSLVALYAPRVHALLRARCGDADLAEELAQSAFVTVAEKLAGMADVSGFESWLFTIALNRLRDEMRRRTRHARPSGDLEALGGASRDPAFEVDPGEPGEPDPRMALLEAALQSLTPPDRQVIDLRHVGGLTFQQMSDLLHEPVGTLLSRHHRAVARLREAIETAQKRRNA